MLAGLVRLKYNSYNLESSFGEDVLVVAVDNKTGQTYSGKIPQPDMSMEPDPVPLDPDDNIAMSEEDLNSLVSSRFNLDLVHDLGIPIAETSYLFLNEILLYFDKLCVILLHPTSLQ